MQSNIKKDYTWNTIGVFAQNAISPLLLIAITRINGIYDSGIFSYAFSVAIIFWALGMWGGRTYQVSDVRQDFAYRSYITARLVLAAVMLAGAVFFSAANHYSVTKSGVILSLVLFKAIESIADALYGILQVHDQLYISGRSLLYKATAGLVIFIIIDLLTKNILAGSVGIILANLVVIFLYDLPSIKEYEDIRIKIAQLSYYAKSSLVILKKSAPVFGVLFLSMFSLNIPRYFIDKFHPEQLGYFGILAMPITLIALLMSFVLQPNVVYLSKLYHERDYLKFGRVVQKLNLITTTIGLSILLAAYVVGIPVLQLVFGLGFSHYKTPLLIITVGGIANALVAVYVNILIIARHFNAPFYTLLMSNIVLAIVSVGMIKSYGLVGGVSLFTAINLIQVFVLASAYKIHLKRASDAQKD